MIVKQFDHIGLNVCNLEESIAFYKDLFGFGLIEKWDDPNQAFIGIGNAVLGLIEVTEYDFSRYTMAHVAFPTTQEEFPEVVAKVKSLGLTIVSGPTAQRGGETILFRDPSGNILEVCYPAVRIPKRIAEHYHIDFEVKCAT